MSDVVDVAFHLEHVHGWNNDSFAVFAKTGMSIKEAHDNEHANLGFDLLNHRHFNRFIPTEGPTKGCFDALDNADGGRE